MKRTVGYAAILLLLAATPLISQTTVNPPPRPAGTNTGPTLDETLNFIRSKLDNTTVNYSIFYKSTTAGTSGTNIFNEVFSNVKVDASTCYLGYHIKRTRDNVVTFDSDAGIYFNTSLNVVVKPQEQAMTELSAKQGHPELIVTSTNPAITVLIVYRQENKENHYIFTDSTLADRVAKAMTHAIELCNGGNKEPF